VGRVHQRVEEPKVKQASVQSRNDAKKGSTEVPERRQVREINLAVPGIDACKSDLSGLLVL
jgi:ribose 5-phosphate isomerase